MGKEGMLRQQVVWTDFSAVWRYVVTETASGQCYGVFTILGEPLPTCLVPSLLGPSGNSEPDVQPAFSSLVWSFWSVFLFYPLHPDFTVLCPQFFSLP